MKLLNYFLSFILLAACAAQKGVKVHAYKQPMLRGSSPVAISDEVLKEQPKQQEMKLSMSYLIYVESAAADFQVKEIWINKEGFSAATEPVEKTPVILKSGIVLDGGADTLVKQTNAKVLLIKPVAGSQVAAPDAALQKKIAGNELVVHCIINGKHQYYTVAAIKKLPPLALQ